MTRYLSLEQILDLHRRALALFGGSEGVRDAGGVEFVAQQPEMTFSGDDLYPTLAEKAAALGFGFAAAQYFVDGNKRTGYWAMATFLALNDLQIDAGEDEKVELMLAIATGTMSRDELVLWLVDHVHALNLDAP